MTELWCYAEGEEVRGPLSLGELVPLLAQIEDIWKRFPTALWGEVAINAFHVWRVVYTTVLFLRQRAVNCWDDRMRNLDTVHASLAPGSEHVHLLKNIADLMRGWRKSARS